MASIRCSQRRAVLAVSLLVIAGALGILATYSRTTSEVRDVRDEEPDDSGDAADGSRGDGDVDQHMPGKDDSTASDTGRTLGVGALDSGAEVRVETANDGIQESAKRLLVRYRTKGACLLRGAGYLDLFGRVWGCVVQGPGWVDICIAEEGSDGQCTSRSVHMEPR